MLQKALMKNLKHFTLPFPKIPKAKQNKIKQKKTKTKQYKTKQKAKKIPHFDTLRL
jgi:hypothetical protein